MRQQALNLARQGRILILRKGRPVDPHAPVKGVVRLALADPKALWSFRFWGPNAGSQEDLIRFWNLST